MLVDCENTRVKKQASPLQIHGRVGESVHLNSGQFPLNSALTRNSGYVSTFPLSSL